MSCSNAGYDANSAANAIIVGLSKTLFGEMYGLSVLTFGKWVLFVGVFHVRYILK